MITGSTVDISACDIAVGLLRVPVAWLLHACCRHSGLSKCITTIESKQADQVSEHVVVLDLRRFHALGIIIFAFFIYNSLALRTYK